MTVGFPQPVPAMDARAQRHLSDLADPQTARAELPILTRYWRIIRRWRWFIIGVILTSLLAGLIITLLMTRMYTATAQLEISRDRDTIVDTREEQPSQGPADLEFYQTQYSLLRARSLAERVADNLRLASDPRFFELFDVRRRNGQEFDALRGANPADRAERREQVVETLMENVGIAPIRGSALVNVSFQSPDAALSVRIANAWAEAFISSTLERRYEATSYARKFLETRLAELRRRLEESERQTVQYAADQGIINVPQQTTAGGPPVERSLTSVELERLNAELTQAVADRISAEAREGGAGAASAESVSNVGLGNIRQRRAEAAAEYADLLARFEPAYPLVQASRARLDALDRSIAREEGRISQSLGGNYRSAVDREASLRGRVDQLKRQVLDQRQRAIQLNIYQRDVETSRELYNALLQRYKQIGIAAGVGTNNVSIVDTAILPDKPSSPNLPANLLLALLFGLTVAGAGTFALQQIDEGVKDPSDIQRLLNLPSLGVVPEVKGGDLVQLLGDRKSSVAEAYLSVQTSLNFATDHGIPRSLVVTSTRPAEGKSVTAFALAKSLWQTNRRAILIDADMRSPSVHVYLGLENRVGLSNYLAGDDGLAGMILTPDDGTAIMTAGPQPPNAAELLSGDRLAGLIRLLLERFDHVIIDAPPVLGLADAPLIASMVEGVVFVLRANGPGSSLVASSLHRLEAAAANVTGVVLTHFDATKAHYGYGYDYGYGYGQEKAPA